MRWPPLHRLSFALLFLVCGLAAAGAFRRACREHTCRAFRSQVRLLIHEGTLALDQAPAGRLHPGRIAVLLYDRDFQAGFRTSLVPGDRHHDAFAYPFAEELDLGLRRCQELVPSPALSAERVFYLGERARDELHTDSTLLRRAITALLDHLHTEPLNALAHLELGLCADALARRLDDVADPDRLSRAARLREVAVLEVRRAIRLAPGSWDFHTGFATSAYVNLLAARFCAARQQEAWPGPEGEESGTHLTWAGRAYQQAQLLEGGQEAMRRMIRELRQEAEHPVSWESLLTLAQPAGLEARLQVVQVMAQDPAGSARAAARLEEIAGEPGLTTAQRHRVLTLLLDSLLRGGDLVRANAHLETLLTLEPGGEVARQALTRYERHHQLESFLDTAEHHLEDRREDRMLRFHAARAAMKLQQYDRAQHHLEQFLDREQAQHVSTQDLREAELLMGQVLNRKGHFGAALVYFKELWSHDATDPEVGLGYARALRGLGRGERARQVLTEMLQRGFRDPEIQALWDDLR